LTILLALTALIALLAPIEVSNLYTGIVPFRAFAVPALEIPQYAFFFERNPQTNLSHVTGISLLVHYPYDNDVAKVIGDYFYGDSDLSANGGFWAGDGLSGFGMRGIIGMSMLCSAIFWFFDGVAREHDPRFVAVAATFIGFSFGSTSLFTTLLTGGWLLLMAALVLQPKNGQFRSVFRNSASQPIRKRGIDA
jgi:hypothetical protein